MAQNDDTWDDDQRMARGERLGHLRDALGLTVIELANELNRVAEQFGFPQRWTGPKVSKMGKGLQNPTLEDLACLAAYDPEQRSEFWWAFGEEKPARLRKQPRAR